MCLWCIRMLSIYWGSQGNPGGDESFVRGQYYMTFERSGSSHINFQKSSVYEPKSVINFPPQFPKLHYWFFSNFTFLASQDALEVMLVTDWLTDWLNHSLDVSIDLTDVTLVTDDTWRRLDRCDSGEWGCLLQTWLMWLWWLRMPSRDLTDVTLVSENAF